MEDDFNLRKRRQLSKSDKSHIGKWDPRIKGLCDKINKINNYYTTSSCSGRIVLLKGKLGKIVKQENAFIFRSHEKVSFNELKKELENVSYKGLVEFKQSTCILHAACRSISDAEEIVRAAKLSGWKHSGIMSVKKRYMVELHSTEHIDFPIMYKGRVLVDDKFLKIVLKEANSRLERVWSKINKLKERV